MRNRGIISWCIFFAGLNIILFLYSKSFDVYTQNVYNADILFPFSLYQGLFNQTSRTDWVFGGYTPFIEVFIGLILWIFSRNIHTTLRLYATIQPLLVTLSLLFLTRRIVGRNLKVASLVIFYSALPMYLFTFGLFNSAWPLFTWYLHITTLCFVIVALGLLIQLLSSPFVLKNKLPSLVFITLIIIVASMSDALFIAQFTIPSVLVIALIILLKIISFRKGAYTGLCILYATATGLALYRLPSIWGSDRLAFYGSYIKPSLNLIAENFLVLARLIPSFWERSFLGNILWIVFYGLCFIQFLLNVKHLTKNFSIIRTRLTILYAFFFIQMVVNIGSGLISLTLGTRYFLPIIFIPLFWGWPFLLLSWPAWLKFLRNPRISVTNTALSVLTVLLLILTILSQQAVPNYKGETPELATCLDENAGQYHIRRGMANYWQARPVTLFSKMGLVVVQVDPDLKPFRILNNSDGYRDEFDFVIVSNDFEPGHWMDRKIVINKFGEPASTFFCGKSEVMIYNRETDTLIKKHFIPFFLSQD